MLATISIYVQVNMSLKRLLCNPGILGIKSVRFTAPNRLDVISEDCDNHTMQMGLCWKCFTNASTVFPIDLPIRPVDSFCHVKANLKFPIYGFE